MAISPESTKALRDLVQVPAEHLGGDYDLIDRVKRNYAIAEISDKMKSLLAIAGRFRKVASTLRLRMSHGR